MSKRGIRYCWHCGSPIDIVDVIRDDAVIRDGKWYCGLCCYHNPPEREHEEA